MPKIKGLNTSLSIVEDQNGTPVKMKEMKLMVDKCYPCDYGDKKAFKKFSELQAHIKQHQIDDFYSCFFNCEDTSKCYVCDQPLETKYLSEIRSRQTELIVCESCDGVFNLSTEDIDHDDDEEEENVPKTKPTKKNPFEFRRDPNEPIEEPPSILPSQTMTKTPNNKRKSKESKNGATTKKISPPCLKKPKYNSNSAPNGTSLI